MNREIIKLIEEHDIITIFRHEFADPDALGSQFGLLEIIKYNYPDKQVYALGSETMDLSNKLYPGSDVVNDELIKKSLAIVVDTANQARIDDQRYQLAKSLVKIDHHPNNEPFGMICFVDEHASATCYLIAQFAVETDLEINELAATYLYSGIVGDTGRFLHNNTHASTFEMAGFLVEKGADLAFTYDKLYSRSLNQVQLNGYILNNFKIVHQHIAYYILEEQDYKQFDIAFDQAKEYVNTLAGIEGIRVWVSATYNPNTQRYHLSLRAKDVAVNKVAEAFGGGGHMYAAGIKVSSLEEFNAVIDAIAKLL